MELIPRDEFNRDGKKLTRVGLGAETFLQVRGSEGTYFTLPRQVQTLRQLYCTPLLLALVFLYRPRSGDTVGLESGKV